MNIIGIDKYASVKFSLISFFAMCAVVSWHIGVEGGWVKRYFCPTFCMWSVPWFFYASGVFLFTLLSVVHVEILLFLNLSHC